VFNSDLQIVEFGDGVVIKCSYKSCVKVLNKSNIQSKTPSIVTNTRDSMILKRIFKKEFDNDVNLVKLSQDSVQWNLYFNIYNRKGRLD
jgi:hypothetical protein